MAISDQTQAIIDRLKAEGDLIRNSGTNSVRSVNLKLEKFDGLFTSINTQITEQTSIMKAQLGINQDTQERTRTQEQFEELNNQRNTNSEQNQEARANQSNINETIDKMGDKIGEAFSMKKLLIGGAAAFVGYNFLKGFIQQAMADNLLGVGDFAENLKKLDIGTFQDNIASMKLSLESAAANLNYFAEKVKEIADMNLLEWGQMLLTSLGTLTLLNGTVKLLNKLIPGKAAGKSTANLIKAALAGGATAASLKSFGYTDDEIKAGQTALDEEAKAKATSNKPTAAMSAGPDSMKPAAAGSIDDLVVSRNGDKVLAGAALQSKITAYNAGVDAGTIDGQRIDFDAAQRRAAELRTQRKNTANLGIDPRGDQLSPPQKIIKPGDIGRKMLQEGGDRLKQSVVANVAKAGIKAIPLLGAVAGVAFAGWSLIRGDTTTAALEGTSIFLPSVSGTAVDITAIATAVFFEFYGQTYNPANEDHNVVMAEIGKMVKEEVDQYLNGKPETGNTTDAIQGYENMSQQDFINMGQNATGTGFVGTGGQLDYSSYLQGYDPYTGTFSGSTGSRSRGGGRGPRPGQGQGYGVLSPQAMEAIAQNNRDASVEKLAPAMQAYLDSVGVESAPNITVIAPNNNVSAPVSMVDGGNQVSMNSYGFGEAGRATNNPMGIPGVTSGLTH